MQCLWRAELLWRGTLSTIKKKQQLCDTYGVVFYRRDLPSRDPTLHDRRLTESEAGSNAPSSASGAAYSKTWKRCYIACNWRWELRIKWNGVNLCASCSKAEQPCEYKRPSGRLSHLPSQFQTTKKTIPVKAVKPPRAS